MIKKWWQSRTIWAALLTIGLAVASMLKVVPDVANDALSIGQIVSGLMTIYFRKTTTTGIGAFFADNRVSGIRT